MCSDEIVISSLGRNYLITRSDQIGFDQIVVVLHAMSVSRETSPWPMLAVGGYCVFIASVRAVGVTGTDGDCSRFVAGRVNGAP